jgi:hypothetical protein
MLVWYALSIGARACWISALRSDFTVACRCWFMLACSDSSIWLASLAAEHCGT